MRTASSVTLSVTYQSLISHTPPARRVADARVLCAPAHAGEVPAACGARSARRPAGRGRARRCCGALIERESTGSEPAAHAGDALAAVAAPLARCMAGATLTSAGALEKRMSAQMSAAASMSGGAGGKVSATAHTQRERTRICQRSACGALGWWDAAHVRASRRPSAGAAAALAHSRRRAALRLQLRQPPPVSSETCRVGWIFSAEGTRREPGACPCRSG